MPRPRADKSAELRPSGSAAPRPPQHGGRKQAPQTPPRPQTSCPRGLEKPHPAKGSSYACGSGDTHSRPCPRPETGLAQSGPAAIGKER